MRAPRPARPATRPNPRSPSKGPGGAAGDSPRCTSGPPTRPQTGPTPPPSRGTPTRPTHRPPKTSHAPPPWGGILCRKNGTKRHSPHSPHSRKQRPRPPRQKSKRSNLSDIRLCNHNFLKVGRVGRVGILWLSFRPLRPPHWGGAGRGEWGGEWGEARRVGAAPRKAKHLPYTIQQQQRIINYDGRERPIIQSRHDLPTSKE
jgi:hypothetical protein